MGENFEIHQKNQKKDKEKEEEFIYLEKTYNFQLLKNSKNFTSRNFDFKKNDEIENSLCKNFTNFHPATFKFLNNNKFDFDSLYKNGINYNLLSNREKIKEILNENFLENSKKFIPMIYLSEKNEKILVEVTIEILKFLIFDENENFENFNFIEKEQ